MMYQKILRTDVTCLSFIDDNVFAGMGSTLIVFNISSLQCFGKINVFHGQKIHGICEGPGRYIAVFGGKEIAVLQYDLAHKDVLSLVMLWEIQDWIYNVQWLEEDCFAVACAHNMVLLWNWRTQQQLSSAICEERCLLYCSSFEGSSWQDLILFSGTIFQEIIIWSPVECNEQDTQCSVLQRLKGHKGVVFSINYNKNNGRIHTTSDDRSVRVWQVLPKYPKEWKSAEVKLLYTLFGHSARVWKSIGLMNMIISVGEDSQLCVWDLEGKLLKSWKVHQGGSVWSLDCSEKLALLATGGSDGGINLWPLECCADKTKSINIPISMTLHSLERMSNVGSEEYMPAPRRVIILSSGRIITVLHSGHLLCTVRKIPSCNTAVLEDINVHQRNSEEEGHPFWKLIYNEEKLIKYCLLEVSPCRQYFALATLDGQIITFRESQSIEATPVKEMDSVAVEGKIFSLHWLSADMILTCGLDGNLELWAVTRTEGSCATLTKTHSFVLPHSKERWVTSALLLDDCIICGDRVGSVHLYRLSKAGDNQIPHQSFLQWHGRLGVSAFASYSSNLYSTGRDGTLRQYCFSTETLQLKQVCSTRLPFCWVASTSMMAGDIIVAGFSDKKFVIWSQQQQRIIFELSCSGGHRSWDCVLNGHSLSFAYVKNKSIYVAFNNFEVYLKATLQGGYHPREVNCLEVLNMQANILLVSAGEDTTIRISIASDQEKFNTLAVLRSHISAVRTLAVHKHRDNSFLVFSAGARAQVKVWELMVQLTSGEQTPEVICSEASSHMLMDSDKQRKSWRHLIPTIDPETRYMSICLIPGSGNFILAGGCSDGFLRVLEFDCDSKSLTLVGSYKFHQRCILNVACVPPYTILTMATNGVIAFWDLECIMHNASTSSRPKHKEELHILQEEMVPFFSCKLHQSGIDCCSLLMLDSHLALLATGGDDAALALTLFEVTAESKQVSEISKWEKESAHIAQVTGVALVNNFLVSASVDQYVFVWQWNYEVSQKALVVSKRAEYISAIGDIHGLRAWIEGSNLLICVYGRGVEVIQYVPTSDDQGAQENRDQSVA